MPARDVVPYTGHNTLVPALPGDIEDEVQGPFHRLGRSRRRTVDLLARILNRTSWIHTITPARMPSVRIDLDGNIRSRRSWK